MFISYPSCGSLFHKIRKRRQLTIHNVQGRLHKTSISYFEYKKSEIRVSNLMEILRTCLVSAESGRIVENRLRSLSCQIIQAIFLERNLR